MTESQSRRLIIIISTYTNIYTHMRVYLSVYYVYIQTAIPAGDQQGTVALTII